MLRQQHKYAQTEKKKAIVKRRNVGEITEI
jgi:hypothetical protein